jgi:hypothetical protein
MKQTKNKQNKTIHLDILQHKTKNIKTGFDNCPSEDIKITAD